MAYHDYDSCFYFQCGLCYQVSNHKRKIKLKLGNYLYTIHVQNYSELHVTYSMVRMYVVMGNVTYQRLSSAMSGFTPYKERHDIIYLATLPGYYFANMVAM